MAPLSPAQPHASARARVSGSLAKKRSYSTCRLPNDEHEMSHARWNSFTRSRALLLSVARYCSITGPSGDAKSAWVGRIIRLEEPSSCRISTIRG